MKWLKWCSKKDFKKTDCTELGKITDTSDLVKEADYDTKIGEIEKKILDHNHDKYTKFPSKNDIANFSKKTIYKLKKINKKLL